MAFHDGCGAQCLLARRVINASHGVGTARELDPDRVVRALAAVVLSQPSPQSASLDADERIPLGIEIGGSTEDLDRDPLALQPRACAGESLLDREAKELGRAFRLSEARAGQDSRERGTNFLGIGLHGPRVAVI